MKRPALLFVPFSLLCLFILAGCAYALQGLAAAAPDTEQAVLDTPEIEQPTAEPTVDFAPTQAALRAIADQAQAEANAANVANIEAQQAALRAEQTAEAVKLAQALVTQQAEIIRATQAAEEWSGKATADASLLTKIAAETEGQVKAREAEALRLQASAALIKAETDAKSAGWQNVTWLLFALMGLTFGVAFIVAMLRRSGAAVEAVADDGTGAETTEPGPAPAYPAGFDTRVLLQNKFTIEQLRALGQGLTEGRALTHDEWTPAEKGFSEGKFATLQYIFVNHGLATWSDETHKGGALITERGLKWAAEIQKTPSLPVALVPKTPETDGYRPIDTQNTPQ
jgi:hypothetical protein